jgi:DNA-binding NtrC family response regulator
MSAELRRRIRDQEILSAATSCLTRTLDMGDRVNVALDFLQEIVGGRSACCYLYDPASDRLKLEGARGHEESGRRPVAMIHNPRGPMRHVLTETGWRWLPHPVSDPAWAQASRDERAALQMAPAVLLLSLGRSGRLVGLVLVYAEVEEDPLGATDSTFLRNLLTQITVALENARLFRLAVMEPESGLATANYFLSRLKEDIDRAAAQQDETTAVLLRAELEVQSVAEARELIRRLVTAIGGILRRSCHDRELIARMAALEFAVLVPAGDRQRGSAIASKAHQRFREFCERAGLRDIRFSSAVASYPEDGLSGDYLMDALRKGLEESAPEELPAADPLWAVVRQRFPGFSFQSPRMRRLLQQLEKLAHSTASVLIRGETGTGKEVAARLVHGLSERRSQSFVAVHCAALPEKLLEAELFGHERGAFTGADRLRHGRFQEANGGTLFLDEVAEIPLPLQVKLLRVLQERQFERLGSNTPIKVDVRVLAATHRSLERMVQQGSFREDLYYRLRVVEVEMPPLRDRADEIPHLVADFLGKHGQERGSPVTVEPAALDVLKAHSWPGNIRELRNVLQRALILGSGETLRRQELELEASGLAPSSPRPAAPLQTEALNDRQSQLLQLLEECGTITSRQYFERTGVSRRTALRDLQDLMERGVVVREGTRKAATYRLRQ